MEICMKKILTFALCFIVAIFSVGCTFTPAVNLEMDSTQPWTIATDYEKCVGRNADYILKDREDVLHTFIHANKEFRADRIVRLYGESEKSPEARLNEKDKRRKINYQHYTGRNWGTARNYDICLDSATIGVEECANIIVKIVKDSQK